MSELFNKSPLAAITSVINRISGSLNPNQCCCASPKAPGAPVPGANLLALTKHSNKNIPYAFSSPLRRHSRAFILYPHFSLKVTSTKQILGYWTQPEISELMKHREKTIAFQFSLFHCFIIHEPLSKYFSFTEMDTSGIKLWSIGTYFRDLLEKCGFSYMWRVIHLKDSFLFCWTFF